MKRSQILLILFSLFFLFSFTNKDKKHCDLLEEFADQHPYIEFIDCNKGEGQVVYYSLYYVAGIHSEEVENYLVEKYGMGKLKFTCCGWEPEMGQSGTIINKGGKEWDKDHHISIIMSGNAEKEDKNKAMYIEKDRNKIDFQIKVEILKI